MESDISINGKKGRLLGIRNTDAAFLFICLVFLYIHLFMLPATPIYYEADHVALLNDAKRMAEGEMLYRDFFDFLFPGSHTFYAVLIYIFGPKYWIVSVAIIFHGLAAAFLGILIARRMMGDTVWAYLPSAIFIFFGFRWFGLDGEHRMFSPLFVYLAILFLITKRTLPRLAAAGASAAVTSFITQQRGFMAVGAIGIFLLIEFGFVERNWKKALVSMGILVGSFAAVLLLLTAPYAIVTGPSQFFEYTILFIKDYAQDPTTNSPYAVIDSINKARNAGIVMAAVTIFYHVISPLIFAAAFIYLWIVRKSIGFAAASGILLVSLVGFFQAAGTPGPNIMRIFQVSVPALIVLVWLISRTRLRSEWLASAAIFMLIMFGLALGVRLQTTWNTETISTASGDLVFLSEITTERYKWLIANAQPGDMVFETYNSHVNFPLGLKNPSRMSILLNTNYSPPHHVRWAIDDLKRARPRYIIWDGAWTAEMPGLKDGERLKPLYEYMSENYTFRQSFTPYDGRQFEIWERNSQPQNDLENAPAVPAL